MIAETTEEAILENQIMYVPPPARWTSERVAPIGDAAHGLPPHIPAGGTLGIEDVGVLRASLTDEPDTAKALARYEAARRPLRGGPGARGRRRAGRRRGGVRRAVRGLQPLDDHHRAGRLRRTGAVPTGTLH